MQKVKIKSKDAGGLTKAKMPTYATPGSNAADVHACIDSVEVIRPGERMLIPLGFAIEVPEGYGMYLIPRSGLGSKQGIVLGNLIGLIDHDYRGEVMACLWNTGTEPFAVNPDDRIAQMCIIPTPQFEFEWVDELSDTERGAGGFNSTGI
jgi:dUTP pyrophosphatase